MTLKLTLWNICERSLLSERKVNTCVYDAKEQTVPAAGKQTMEIKTPTTTNQQNDKKHITHVSKPSLNISDVHSPLKRHRAAD